MTIKVKENRKVMNKKKFIEILNDTDISEISVEKENLLSRARYAKRIEKTDTGFKLYFEAYKPKYNTEMELLHSPKTLNGRFVSSESYRTFYDWLEVIYA